MSEPNLSDVVKVLEKSAKLVRATRRLLVDVGVVFPHVSELEQTLRDQAASLRLYIREVEEDSNRPLLGS